MSEEISKVDGLEEVINKMCGSSYEDENGMEHILDKELSRGGQGVVFKTKDPQIIIKFEFDKDESGQLTKAKFGVKEFFQFRNNIQKVQILPLPEGMPIARPEVMLTNSNCGYAMKMLEGMVPLKSLIEFGKENIGEFFLETGGLKKRLIIFMKLARIFHMLQIRDIVYGDLSFNNVFISEDKDYNEVWLIDADNMRYSLDSVGNVFTPGIGAPEVVVGETSNTVYSDRFSFAVLLFYALTTNHPFVGYMVTNPNDGEDDDWDDDDWDDDDWDVDDSDDSLKNTENGEVVNLYDRAYRGEFPWIGDRSGKNSTDKGIDMNLVINDELFKLFDRTFNRDGILEPLERPDFSQWYKALKTAIDSLIECPHCHSTYYESEKKCPFCESATDEREYYKVYITDIVKVDNIFLDSEKELNSKYDTNHIQEKETQVIFEKVGKKCFDISSEPQYLYRYHTHLCTLDNELDETIKFIFKKDGEIEIENLCNKDIKECTNDEIKPFEKKNIYITDSHYDLYMWVADNIIRNIKIMHIIDEGEEVEI